MNIKSLLALFTTSLLGVFFVASGAQAATRSIQVTVTDQSDDPAVGIWVSGWSDDMSTTSGWAYEQTDSNGVASWDLSEDDSGQWYLSTWGDGFSSSYSSEGITTEDSGVTAVSLSVNRTDATLRLNLVDGDGASVAIPLTSWGSASCYTADWTNYFWGSFNPGESTVDISVVAGTYTCEAWVDGYGAVAASATVSSSETKEMDITLLAHDATLNIALVDENGDPITSVESFSAYAYSVTDPEGNDYYNDFAWSQGGNGTAELNVLSGDYVYQVGVWVDDTSNLDSDVGSDDSVDSGSGDLYEYKSGGLYSTGSGTKYIQNYEMVTIASPTSGAETTVPFTLEEADGTIEVTVLGTDGKPDPYSWVSAVDASAADWSGYVGASANENGVATLYVKSGITYEVSAYPTGAWTGDVLPPENELVLLKKDGSKSLNMQAVKADHTINITATFGAESLGATAFGADYAFCFVYDSKTGRQNWGELVNGSGEIAWLSNTTAWIGCDGFGENTYYRASDTKVVTGDKDGETSVTVNLTEAGNWYDDTTYTFDNSAGSTTIELPDGESELIVPKEALASDTITLTVGSASGLPSSDSDYNAGVNWDFSARDSAGNEITEFSQDLTLHISYDEDRLADMGLVEEDLAAASFDEDTNSYTSTSSTSVDTEKNVVTASVAHFSSYSLVGDKGLGSSSIEKPNQPKKKKLVVKKRKNKQVNLTWKAISSADSYTLQVRKCKNEEKAQCAKAKDFQKKAKYRKFSGLSGVKKTVKKLKAAHLYQWRLKACNDAGCSNFTQWKRFSTKG